MTGYFSRLSPIPGFPAYTGPHKVGTVDVELPVANLDSPASASIDHLPTVQYRIFYPCKPEAKGKAVSWIPAPQRGYLSAYTRFLGAGNILSEFISYFPTLLYYITIPVTKNAPILEPTTPDHRWPVVFFSHGLGGSRNAYSQLVGSIASHGVVVIVPEHRDSSTPISYIRDVPADDASGEKHQLSKYGKRTVDYKRYSHIPSPEVETGRNEQLRIRLWELGCIHDSVIKVDQGVDLTNLNTSSASLLMFRDKMDVHTPGKTTFVGHSFGAATMTQFVKSTYYAPQNCHAPATYHSLFTPSSRSAIASQITPQTPVVLLDPWCLPLRASSTRWLWDKPFPCYQPTGAGGDALLTVESQAFYRWAVHLKATKRLLSPNPATDDYDYQDGAINKPHFYYARNSAHLSQSDFGLLFPWVVKKVFAAEEPERVMRLNVRGILQLMRNNNIHVSATTPADMELPKTSPATEHDELIFNEGDKVRGWHWISTDVEDLPATEDMPVAKGDIPLDMQKQPIEHVVGQELQKEQPAAAEQLTSGA